MGESENERLRRITLERMAAKGTDKLEVYQGEELVGYMAIWPPMRSTTALYDIRPGDFREETRGGKRVLVAHWSLGPGDLDAISTFRRIKPDFQKDS